MPQLSLPAEPASVSRARHFVRGAVQTLGAPAVVDDAELLISELATNAVLHARSAFTVEVSRSGERLRICVADSSALAPRVRAYRSDSTTGRGLQLVQTLSAAWGVQPRRPGKTVWVELLVDGSSAPPPGDEDGATWTWTRCSPPSGMRPATAAPWRAPREARPIWSRCTGC
jgi:anti-sigma regulatory factor (Ser/Thr protein kinase)